MKVLGCLRQLLLLQLASFAAFASMIAAESATTGEPEISDGLDDAPTWSTNALDSFGCFSGNSETPAVYFVVLDAGSTGTRAVAHAFRRDTNSPLGLEHTGYARFRRKPGLSAFRNFPGKCRRQLDALLADAAAAVPKERRARTCVLLRATAGFRLMDDRSRYLIAREARAALSNSEFAVPRLESVRMLEGSQEAKYTWLSVNYVLGNFQRMRDPAASHGVTRPVIEMGGGSLQIAYESPDGEESLTGLSTAPGQPRRTPSQHRLRLRARSYLGLGIRESVLRFVGHDGIDRDDDIDDQTSGGRASYRTPCLAANLTLDFTFGPVEVQLNGSSHRAAVAADQCLARARHLIAELGVRSELALNQPGNRPVYAISGLYHLLQFLHRRGDGWSERVRHNVSVCPGRDRCQAYSTSVGDLAAAADAVCRDLPIDAGPFKPYYCINLAVTAAMLKSSVGMGLTDDTPLTALGDQEALGWTLGLSLDYLRASAAAADAASQGKPTAAVWVTLLAVCCSFTHPLIVS